MKNKKVILQSLFLAFLVIGSIWIVKRHRNDLDVNRNLQPGTKVMERGYLMNEGSVFGTIYHITYEFQRDLKKDIEQTMKEIDESLSMFNPQSTLARINAGETDEADKMVEEILNLSFEVHKATNGCFDPTVAPLVNAWGFGFKNGTLPDSVQVDSLRELVGLDKVTLKDHKITKQDSRIIMDFSAIAKGYAVDKVAETLRKKGVKNYMVEIGGEVVVKGISPKNKAWRVGIAKPTETEGRNAKGKNQAVKAEQDNGLQEILDLKDKAMATSGNYRNFYVTEDGRKLAHTIDPYSGYPIQHSILSSTVFAPTCAMADAFATAFMVMGLEEAKKVLKTQPQLEAYFIYTDEKGEYAVYNNMK